MFLTINIVGAGKLGQTIGRLIVKNNLAKIVAVYNRSIENAKHAIQFMGDGQPFCEIKLMPAADITIISTPDDKISETCINICQSANINPGNIFMHCSGLLSSDILSAVKAKKGLIASVHPMRSFANPKLSVENYPGTYCAMEGDTDALKIIAPLFKAFGSILYPINKDKKSLYHVAGVFASNYLITLAQQSAKCAQDAGIEEKIALKIIINLMRGSLANLEKSMSLQESLTGPIKRGDIGTIKNHLAALTEDKLRLIYSVLGDATLELSELETKTKEKIHQILCKQIP